MSKETIASRMRDDGREVFELTGCQISARDEIRAKVLDGRYALCDVPCPLCGGSDMQSIACKDAYGLPVSTVVCRNCGLVHTNPRLTEDALTAMYGTEYTNLDRVLPNSKDYFELENRKGERIFGTLERHGLLERIRGRLVVDVGCGAGGVLGYFQDRGFAGMGCDLVPKNLRYGVQVMGLDLHYGGLEVIREKLRGQSGRVGLVIYEQVFEHLTNPQAELEKLRFFMPPDALLYVGVPGLRNIDEHYGSDLLRFLQLPHLVHFDLSRLSAMLAMHGFALRAGDETISAIYSPQSSQLPFPLADYREVVGFLEAMEARRGPKARRHWIQSRPARIAKVVKRLLAGLPLPGAFKERVFLVLRRVYHWAFR